jgi:hypothetical protein
VNLKSVRLKPPPEPQFIENPQYFRLLRHASSHSAPPQRSAPSPLLTAPPESESPPQWRPVAAHLRAQPSRDVELEANERLIDCVSMDLDGDDSIGFL